MGRASSLELAAAGAKVVVADFVAGVLPFDEELREGGMFKLGVRRAQVNFRPVAGRSDHAFGGILFLEEGEKGVNLLCGKPEPLPDVNGRRGVIDTNAEKFHQ